MALIGLIVGTAIGALMFMALCKIDNDEIFKFISIFNPKYNSTPPPKKTICQLDILDDVWVKDGDILYKGWVFDKTRRHITVCYDKYDYRFRIAGQEYVIEQENKTLFCNKPE